MTKNELVLRCMEVEKGKSKLREHFDHPLVQNAALECCENVCNVLEFLELDLTPQMAMNISRILCGSLARQTDQWVDYIENGAPYNNEEFMAKFEEGVE